MAARSPAELLDEEVPQSYDPQNWSVDQAVHGLKELERIIEYGTVSMGIETQLREDEPDIARDRDDHLAFNVWNCDAELLAHLPHHFETEAF